MTSEQVERGCEAVWKAITGKCWHKENLRIKPYHLSDGRIARKCGKCANVFTINPPLATSLDAWAEHIWPVMDAKQIDMHNEWLDKMANALQILTPLWQATPLHHLEAALRALNLYDEVMK